MMARRFPAIYKDDFGGGLNWSPERRSNPPQPRYIITDAADEGLREQPRPEIVVEDVTVFENENVSNWIPNESFIIGIGACLSMLALVFQLYNGSWKPELFWLSLILGLVAVAKTKTR